MSLREAKEFARDHPSNKQQAVPGFTPRIPAFKCSAVITQAFLDDLPSKHMELSSLVPQEDVATLTVTNL